MLSAFPLYPHSELRMIGTLMTRIAFGKTWIDTDSNISDYLRFRLRIRFICVLIFILRNADATDCLRQNAD
ncbi:MAG: hypothetical protein WCY25_04930 [Moheibacter sp.]